MSKTTTLGAIFGFVVGIALVSAVGWTTMPGMILKEAASPYGLEETVNKIKENAQAHGWVVAGVKKLHKSVKKHGGPDILPVMLIELCEPNHASNILTNDSDRMISVMMPSKGASIQACWSVASAAATWASAARNSLVLRSSPCSWITRACSPL